MAIRRSSWSKTHKPSGDLAKWARGHYFVRSAESGRFLGRNHRNGAGSSEQGASRPEAPPESRR